MRHESVGRAAVVGLALLFLLSVSSTGLPAEKDIVLKVSSLKGTASVTKADGTTETLTDTSKPIALPATIEMVGAKGSFSVLLPTALTGKFNSVSWTQRKGETVKVSVLETKNGVRFEYLKGARKLYLNINNRENVLGIASVKGTTKVVVLQNRVTIPENASALVTTPMNVFSSVTVQPSQISEVEFAYAPERRFIEYVQVVSRAGNVQVTRAGRTTTLAEGEPAVERPITITPTAERLTIPVPEPETVEQSPFVPLP